MESGKRAKRTGPRAGVAPDAASRGAASIRIACLGAGYFSRFHHDAWSRIEGATPVAVCDAEISRAKATGLPAFSDLGGMLDAVGPELLDIIVPPAGHAEAIRTALGRGVRWLICQKPFCRSLAEARTVTAEAEAAGATLVIHENFRFQPWYRAIRRMLAEGRVGTPLQATFRLRPGDGQGPDAYLERQPYFQTMPRFLVHETAVHWIDTFRFLFGDPQAVYADLRRVNPHIAGEDAGYIIFEHSGGVRALFDGNRHLDHAADNLRRTMGEALIEGTGGTITLTGDGSVRLRRFGETGAAAVLGPDTSDTFGGDCVHALQSHVIAAMRDGVMPENTASEYLKVIEIEEAVYASAASGSRVSFGS